MVLGDLMRALHNEIVPKISPVMEKLGLNENLWLSSIGNSTDKSHGDITLPCHAFSKILRKSPTTYNISSQPIDSTRLIMQARSVVA